MAGVRPGCVLSHKHVDTVNNHADMKNGWKFALPQILLCLPSYLPLLHVNVKKIIFSFQLNCVNFSCIVACNCITGKVTLNL